MTDDPRELARLLVVLGDVMERRGSDASSGIVRRAARLLATMPAPITADACPSCGETVVQPERGRHRVYCSTLCKRRVANQRRNGTVAA